MSQALGQLCRELGVEALGHQLAGIRHPDRQGREIDGTGLKIAEPGVIGRDSAFIIPTMG
ncbi:hypothetical protein [Sphingomonas tagetis]|uniref:hypothetical protein n=1 Tax=Sphingomonas tagetis TaxID=2949092 RepID=UPI0020B8C7E0|nr:hypothetical protein [Sphingomonas tagetis]